ncbi:MAG: PAS domain S-box protein, partial [Chitinophagaceae bacterium]|nr:PAS domain S-box protein [Rubrivivax sp.]
MDGLSSFFGRNGFLPHGYCFQWAPDLLWSMVGADALTAAAYFSIPLAIVSFVRQRGAVGPQFKGVAWLFSAFIFACGVTHVLGVWTLWRPDYGLLAMAKVLTAGISTVTAVALWPLIPRALKLPSVGQLQAAVTALEAEVRQRRTAEEQVVDIAQSLAVTLASIEAGFIAADATGRVTQMNAVAESVTGWSRAQALGHPVWEVFSREGHQAADEPSNPVQELTERGVTIDTVQEVVAVGRHGLRSSLELHAGLTRAPDGGAVLGLVLVFRDMTRLNQVEAERRRLAAIVESSNDAIVGKALDGRITNWNGGAERLFGYTAEEAVGRPVQMLFPVAREAEEMRILADLARGQHVPAFDTQRLAKDGRLLEVSVTVSPIRDAAGRIVGAAKIARDVSHQRQAEAALRDSEARLRFALEAGQIGDWDLDLVNGTTRRSIRHDRCFGYDTLQPQWDLAIFLCHVHPDDREAVQGVFDLALDEQRPWHVECRVVWPDGSLHWIGADGSVLIDRGRPLRMLGIVTDITQARQAEETRLTAQRLEAENLQYQAASRMKSQFLANMSHELRTPLNAIIGFADLLHAGAVPITSPKHHTFLGHIATSGRHLLQLINDVLDLSKVEAGKLEFSPEPVNLTRLVGDVGAVLHTGLQRKHLSLQIDVEPGLDGLVLDPARLKQALFNYLSNAIKFTPEGGRIEVRAHGQGPTAFRIEVHDSGIGIAPADLSRLFVEFQQLDAGYSKLHQGTGLGLALTRRMVQAQGGSVGVISAPGAGSVFHLVLPRQHGKTVAERADLADATAPGRRLLVMHGDPGQQAELAQSLNAAGFDVDTAASSGEALQQAQSQSYAGLTIDLAQPDQTGLGVLADIRRGGPSSQSPVLAVSMAIVSLPAA